MNLIFPIILLCLVAAPICRGKIVSDERRWSDEDGEDEDNNHDDDDNSDEDRGHANDGDLGGLAKYGPAPIGHNGQVIDTGEVEHAKGLHFQAYAKMASLAAQHGRGKGHRDDGRNQWRGNGEQADNSDAGSLKWSGPFADVELTSDGFLKYTPEVAYERAKHLSAHAAATALAEQNGSSGLDNGYSGEQDGGQDNRQDGEQDGGREREQDSGQDESIEQNGDDNSDEQDEY